MASGRHLTWGLRGTLPDRSCLPRHQKARVTGPRAGVEAAQGAGRGREGRGAVIVTTVASDGAEVNFGPRVVTMPAPPTPAAG